MTKIYSVQRAAGRPATAADASGPSARPTTPSPTPGSSAVAPSARPGELSLAHRGVLFLDEFPEFRRNVLEVLRQPLEDGVVHIARANHHVSYPAQVMLVAAMNPCPCGRLGVPGTRCTCPRNRVLEYHARVSGPLLDRIDITVLTRRVEGYRLAASAKRRDRRARTTASAWRPRASGSGSGSATSRESAATPRCRRDWSASTAGPHPGPRRCSALAMDRYGLSARAHDRILKLARTRADLEGHREHRGRGRAARRGLPA